MLRRKDRSGCPYAYANICKTEIVLYRNDKYILWYSLWGTIPGVSLAERLFNTCTYNMLLATLKNKLAMLFKGYLTLP